jgi:hypothetical protein
MVLLLYLFITFCDCILLKAVSRDDYLIHLKMVSSVLHLVCFLFQVLNCFELWNLRKLNLRFHWEGSSSWIFRFHQSVPLCSSIHIPIHRLQADYIRYRTWDWNFVRKALLKTLIVGYYNFFTKKKWCPKQDLEEGHWIEIICVESSPTKPS